MLDRRRKSSKPPPRKSTQIHHYIADYDLDDDDDDESEEGPTLESQFYLFVRHRSQDETATEIGLQEINMWLKQAGVLRVRQLTMTDTGDCYFHFKKCKLDFYEYKEFLELLASRKRISLEEMIDKLVNCGPPQVEEKN